MLARSFSFASIHVAMTEETSLKLAADLLHLLPTAIFFLILIWIFYRMRKTTKLQNEAIAICREQADLTRQLVEEIKGLRADLKK